MGNSIVISGVAFEVVDCLPFKQGCIGQSTVIVVLPEQELEIQPSSNTNTEQTSSNSEPSSSSTTSSIQINNGVLSSLLAPHSTLISTPTPRQSIFVGTAICLQKPIVEFGNLSIEPDRHRQVVVSPQALRALRCFSGSWVCTTMAML